MLLLLPLLLPSQPCRCLHHHHHLQHKSGQSAASAPRRSQVLCPVAAQLPQMVSNKHVELAAMAQGAQCKILLLPALVQQTV